MLDVQPVLDKLHELATQQGSWIAAHLILSPDGDGSVTLENLLDNKLIAEVEFGSEDNMLEAVDRLAAKASEALTS